MNKYLAVEGLGKFLLDKMSEVRLVSRHLLPVVDLVGGDDKGAGGAGVAIEEPGEDVRHVRGQDHVHVQGHGVLGQAIVPGDVPEVVLGIVVARSPLCILLIAVQFPETQQDSIERVNIHER